MSREANIIANVIATVEATVPRTPYDSTTAFRVVRGFSMDKQPDSAKTRRFRLTLPGGLTWTGEASQDVLALQLSFEIELEFAYRSGSDAVQLQSVILEDMVSLARALTTPLNYDKLNTGIWTRNATDYDVVLADKPGEATLVVLPITLTFTPE